MGGRVMDNFTELERLEESSNQLVLGEDEIQCVGNEVMQYVYNFWSNLPKYKAVVKDVTPSEKIFEQSIEEDGKSLRELLGLFDESVTHTGVQTASGGFIGYIPCGGIPLAAFADFIAAATNKFAGVYSVGPGAVNIENHVLAYFASVFGFDAKTFGGNFCSGGSIGNLMCVATARDEKHIKGQDYDRAVVYGSSQIHFCAAKAIRILGMKETLLRKISVDKDYCIDTSILEKTLKDDIRNGLKPFLIVASAGSTPCGAIDNIEQLSLIAKKYDCWLHVDGSYGGFFYLLDEMKSKYKGIEKCDSLVIDLHKSLFLPYGSAIVLVREKKSLLRTFSYCSSLIDNSDNLNNSPADVSPELSRNFRGLRAWLPLQYHGIGKFKDALREKIILTKYAYERMKEFDYLDLGPYPQLSVFIFRFNRYGLRGNKCKSIVELNNFNRKMNDAFHEDGRTYLSNTEINGEYWMRVAVLSIRTHKKEIDIMVDMIQHHFESCDN